LDVAREFFSHNYILLEDSESIQDDEELGQHRLIEEDYQSVNSDDEFPRLGDPVLEKGDPSSGDLILE
jgi:hypothetical protein